MADISGAMSQMVIMVLIVVIGFAATRAKVIGQDSVKTLSNLLFYVTLPCTMLGSVNSMDSSVGATQIGLTFVLSIAQFLLLFACAEFCNLILRTPKEQRVLYIFMSICTNVGFIGLPLVAAIYGQQSVVLTSIYITMFGFFVNSVGFGILAPEPEDGKRKIPWKAMLNPAMISSVITIVLVVTGFKWPAILSATLSSTGAVTSPVAMLIVGILIADSSFKRIMGEWRLYPYIVIRQLVFPALIYLVLQALGVDPLLSGVFTIVFAMPVGSMVPTFATIMGCDTELPTKAIALSTIGAFACIPLLVLFMSLV